MKCLFLQSPWITCNLLQSLNIPSSQACRPNTSRQLRFASLIIDCGLKHSRLNRVLFRPGKGTCLPESHPHPISRFILAFLHNS